MKTTLFAVLLAASLLCAGGCTRHESSPSTELPAPAAANNVAGPSSAGAGLQGVVAERLDVPNYTYLRLQTAQGEVWAAIPTSSVKVGTEVTLVNPMPMHKFESKALKRTFDVILFASGIATAGVPDTRPATPDMAAGATNATAAPMGIGRYQVDPRANLSDIKLARASGDDGHTIAEIFAQSKSLRDKKVTVHARVVKVTPEVMGRNWLHVRDGTGSDAAKNNDLVVTTADEAKLNEDVTVTGVVHTDRDFGAGYVYSVLLEDARVSR